MKPNVAHSVGVVLPHVSRETSNHRVHACTRCSTHNMHVDWLVRDICSIGSVGELLHGGHEDTASVRERSRARVLKRCAQEGAHTSTTDLYWKAQNKPSMEIKRNKANLKHDEIHVIHKTVVLNGFVRRSACWYSDFTSTITAVSPP